MSSADPGNGGSTALERRHLRFGWGTLVVFLLLGLLLDLLHGFKVSWYLDVSAQPRRLMWTLAHTHGTLVALVNVIFGLTLQRSALAQHWVRRASPCLLSAAILLPGGFFLGGLSVHGGDPGPGVLVVPLGALLLIAGVCFTALALRDGPS